MTLAGLERALGMLLDAAFCDRFLLTPSVAVWEARLPPSLQVDALSGLSRVAIARFRDSLEPSPRGRRKTNAGSQP
jgi:hypothetical protein